VAKKKENKEKLKEDNKKLRYKKNYVYSYRKIVYALVLGVM
jgi:hypothetical protein